MYDIKKYYTLTPIDSVNKLNNPRIGSKKVEDFHNIKTKITQMSDAETLHAEMNRIPA